MAHVLVVEDDADIGQLLARRLRTYGHDVLVAPSGRMALKLVGLDFQAEVVVLDVNLPGMNGFDLLEELRRHPELDDPHLPAVFLSGAISDENVARSKALGCAYLSKPFVSGELQGALVHALEAAQQAREEGTL